MAPYVVEKVKTLILTGPTAGKIEAVVKADPGYAEGTPKILHAENLEEAVALAAGEAAPGDIVTLSPACASFDAYPNFAVRGNRYKALVKEL